MGGTTVWHAEQLAQAFPQDGEPTVGLDCQNQTAVRVVRQCNIYVAELHGPDNNTYKSAFNHYSGTMISQKLKQIATFIIGGL